jgi:hypothetical protein
MTKKTLTYLSMAAIALLATAQASHAQVFFTGVYSLTGPGDVTSPGGISALGSSFDGLQGLPSGDNGIIKPTETIGDVTFNTTQGGSTSADNDDYISLTNVGAGTDGSFNSSSAAYNSVLAGVAYTDGTSVGTITIGSTDHPLTLGSTYQVQLFDAAGSNDDAVFTSGPLPANSIALAGDDYALGEFVATASTQIITFTPTAATNNAGVLSAIDVRLVPEPSTYGALALGLVVLAGIGRMRRRAATILE